MPVMESHQLAYMLLFQISYLPQAASSELLVQGCREWEEAE